MQGALHLVVSASLLALAAGLARAEEPEAAPRVQVSLSFDDPAPPPELAATRTVLARLLPNAPRVDGRLDDEVWRQASALGSFYRIGTKQTAPFETDVQVGHFDGVLYVGAQCEEPDPARRAGQAAMVRDQPVWGGDALEVLLDSLHDRRTVHAVVVNPAGSVADYLVVGAMKNLGWDSGCLAAVGENESGWSVEMAIPRFSLDSPENDIIGFNVVRQRSDTEGAPFTWSPASELYEEGAWLGNLSFETHPCSIQKVEVGWPYVGSNRIRVWLRNATDRDQNLRVGLATRRPNRKVDQSKYRFTLPAGKVVQYGFSHRFGAAGRCDLVFALMQEKHDQPIARFLRPRLDVAESPLVLELVKSGAKEAVRARFRILLPMRDLSGVRFAVSVRAPQEYRTLGRREVRSPASRSGEITVDAGNLPAGEYQLVAYLSRGGKVFAHVREAFAVAPQPKP